jgi:hypothetical protein
LPGPAAGSPARGQGFRAERGATAPAQRAGFGRFSAKDLRNADCRAAGRIDWLCRSVTRRVGTASMATLGEAGAVRLLEQQAPAR